MSDTVRRARVLPGFGLSLGFATAYLGLLVLVPFAALGLKASELSVADWWRALAEPRALAAFGLSFGAAFGAALANLGGGLLVAWVLVRYSFPGKGLVDALVDLPFALPTAVAGITLTAVFAPQGWLGSPLAAIGLPVAYTRLGVGVALLFVGLPFVVRTVQPVLEDLRPEFEEAAASLGASRAQTIRRVVWPEVFPAAATGFALAFARGVGEYGSVVFISGNMPGKTEIAPLLIVTKLEQYDYAGAAAIAVAMLACSLALLFAINALQAWSGRGRIA